MSHHYSARQVNGCCEASCSLRQYSHTGHRDDTGDERSENTTRLVSALEQFLLTANIALALGSAIAGLISYLRKGLLFKLVTSVDRIEHTEQKVNEIWEWRGDAEVVLIALAYDSEEVKESKVEEKFGGTFTVNELRIKDGDDNRNNGSTDGGE